MERYRFSEQEQALLERLPHPFAVYQFVDKRVIPLVLSDGFCELFGYADNAQAYRDMSRDLYRDVHPDDAARIANAAYLFATEDAPYEVIYRARFRDSGAYHVIHSGGRHVWTESGARLAHVWYTDEGAYVQSGEGGGTELNRALNLALYEESLLNASRYDALTGLPSMSHFFEMAESGKDAISREGGRAALLYFDLSGMKFYNRSHSFSEGDKLLKGFGTLLSRTYGKENCCHIGADHFAAYTGEEGLEDTLRLLLTETATLNDGKSLPVHIGIYSSALEEVPVSTACDRAKLACDTLKGIYESAFRFYTSELSESAMKKQYFIGNLERAIREGWIRVFYQPIVRAVNGRVCDEEALARWDDPERGLLSPGEFIPTLEEAGLAYRLDLHVLDLVLEKLRRQREAGLFLVPQSINLSRSDFDACDMVEEFRLRVDASGLPRRLITVEITESVIGGDFRFMKEQVERFQSLGFPVWMDDFGSGYSSLDVLQSIKFNLLKFDMSFMQKLDEGEEGKIILTELMKMATFLGVDTVCEGVETEAQARFLQEIGCSKLQGFYYCRPVPFETILERYHTGRQIGFEDPRESDYYEAIGRVNLYDLAVIANEDENAFQNFFNTLPMGILELRDGKVSFTRTNQSYRAFLRRFFGVDLSRRDADFAVMPDGHGASFMKLVQRCCANGSRAFFDEQMPDGSVVHSFGRKIAVNPVTGTMAAAVAVLSIAEADEGTTYASIARALAADYYNIYCVDLDTDRFIEYSSPVGGEELAIERHGEDFFESSRRDAYRIFEEDREIFYAAFNKETIVRELNQQGVFTVTYRLMDSGVPVYVNMKITRTQPGSNRIIIGISVIDSQMKQKEEEERIQRERDMLARLMALSSDYMTLYTVNPETGRYIEYDATDEYRRLGLAGEGEDFFAQSLLNGRAVIWPEDYPRYCEELSKEKVLRAIEEKGVYTLQYRLRLDGQPRPVSLRIAPFRERGELRLVVGVRAWQERQ